MITHAEGSQALELLPMAHFTPEAVRARVDGYLLALKQIPAAGSQPATGKVLSLDEQSLTTAAPCQAALAG